MAAWLNAGSCSASGESQLRLMRSIAAAKEGGAAPAAHGRTYDHHNCAEPLTLERSEGDKPRLEGQKQHAASAGCCTTKEAGVAGPRLQAKQAHDQQRDGAGALPVHGGRLEVAVQVAVGRDAQLPLARPQLPQRLCAAQAHCGSAETMQCIVAPLAEFQASSALTASLLK